MKNNHKTDYYAHALFDISRIDETIDRSEEELRQLKDAITSNIDFKKYLTDPSIPVPEKIRAAFDIFGGQACPAIQAFISVLIILDAVEQIEQVYNDYRETINNFKKQVSIDIISAVELDKKTVVLIKKEIDLKENLDVRIRNIVDPGILGGIVIKIGDRVIDLSVNNKIEDLRNKLKSIELRGEEFGTEN